MTALLMFINLYNDLINVFINILWFVDAVKLLTKAGVPKLLTP